MFPPLDNTLRWTSRDVQVGYELVTLTVAVVDGIEVALVWQLATGSWTTWLAAWPAESEQAPGDPFRTEMAARRGVERALARPVPPPARRHSPAGFHGRWLGEQLRQPEPPVPAAPVPVHVEIRQAVVRCLEASPEPMRAADVHGWLVAQGLQPPPADNISAALGQMSRCGAVARVARGLFARAGTEVSP